MSDVQMVFVPVSRIQLASLATGAPLAGPLTAYQVTPELIATFEVNDSEDADLAALQLASVAGLVAYGWRLVLVAQVAPELITPGKDRANGEVMVARLNRSQVEAFFVAGDLCEPSAAAAVAGLDLDSAWAHPEVQTMLSEHDLLWHSVVELGAVSRRVPADEPELGE